MCNLFCPGYGVRWHRIMDLSANRLTGDIPNTLTSLTNLGYVRSYRCDASFAASCRSPTSRTRTHELLFTSPAVEAVDCLAIAREWLSIPRRYLALNDNRFTGDLPVFAGTVDVKYDYNCFSNCTLYPKRDASCPCYSPAIDPAERQALVDLFLATDGGNWIDRKGWSSNGTDNPCDGWQLVTCTNSVPNHVKYDKRVCLLLFAFVCSLCFALLCFVCLFVVLRTYKQACWQAGAVGYLLGCFVVASWPALCHTRCCCY